jgi:hypothetical protein
VYFLYIFKEAGLPFKDALGNEKLKNTGIFFQFSSS